MSISRILKTVSVVTGSLVLIVVFLTLVTAILNNGVAPKAAEAHTLAASDVNVNDLLSLTNQDRAANDDTPLAHDSKLDASAQAKCNDMVANGYYDHVSPTGVKWIDFIKQQYPNFELASENIASYFSGASASAVNHDWMNSAGHKANILDKRFTAVGFAACLGNYQSHPTVFVVEHFIELPVATQRPVEVSTQLPPSTISQINCSQKYLNESNAYLGEYSQDSSAVIAYSSSHTPAADPSWRQDDAWYKSYMNGDLAIKQAQHNLNLSLAGCTQTLQKMIIF